MRQRLAIAVDEVAAARDDLREGTVFDHVVINDDLDATVARVAEIVDHVEHGEPRTAALSERLAQFVAELEAAAATLKPTAKRSGECGSSPRVKSRTRRRTSISASWSRPSSPGLSTSFPATARWTSRRSSRRGRSTSWCAAGSPTSWSGAGATKPAGVPRPPRRPRPLGRAPL